MISKNQIILILKITTEKEMEIQFLILICLLKELRNSREIFSSIKNKKRKAFLVNILITLKKLTELTPRVSLKTVQLLHPRICTRSIRNGKLQPIQNLTNQKSISWQEINSCWRRDAFKKLFNKCKLKKQLEFMLQGSQRNINQK